jgi:hypothetical protein
VSADVLADAEQRAGGIEQAGGMQPARRPEPGWRRRSGSTASRARSTTGPSGSAGAWTATSSSAPRPQIPQEEVV